MRFGSLFSGIGGFDLGFERAGMKCAWQVEIDKDCQRVLTTTFPNIERFEDVTKTEQLSAVDVICGGFPCQDLSVAGKRKGLAGERSGLWFEFLRIIGLNRPRWIVIENVPGLLSSDEGRDFAAILRGLVECGYCLAWRVLDAQFYGVAQRRRRVFIVGSLGDGSCAEILFESESVSWNPPTRREAGTRVTPILEAGARTNGDGRRDGDGIGIEGDPMFTLQSGKQHAVAANNFGERDVSTALSSKNERIDGDTEPFVVAATLDQRGRGPTDAVMMNLQVQPGYIHPRQMRGSESSNQVGIKPDAEVTDALTQEGPGAVMVANCFNGYTGGPDDNDAQANHLIAFSSKDHGADAGEIAPTLRSQSFKDSHMNGGGQAAIAFSAGQGSKARSLAESEEHSPPLKAANSGLNQVPAVQNRSGVRRLTPRECERLQGFPDDWTLYDANGKEISDSARYRMLGNAVCVNVAEWIGKRIMAVTPRVDPESLS